jgi:hypothetical protein
MLTSDQMDVLRKILGEYVSPDGVHYCAKEIAAWHTASLAKAREEALQECSDVMDRNGVQGLSRTVVWIDSEIEAARALRLTAPGRD